MADKVIFIIAYPNGDAHLERFRVLGPGDSIPISVIEGDGLYEEIGF
jgi:hypothetical protein